MNRDEHKSLAEQTPPPARARLAGFLDTVRASDRSFVLVLQMDSAAKLFTQACSAGESSTACAALPSVFGAEDLPLLNRNKQAEGSLEKSCSSQASAYYMRSIGAPQKPMVGGSCAVLAMLMRAHPAPNEDGRAESLSLRACHLGAISACPR